LYAPGVPFAFSTGAGDVVEGSGLEKSLLLPKPFNLKEMGAVLEQPSSDAQRFGQW
jgi:hypothetical protein